MDHTLLSANVASKSQGPPAIRAFYASPMSGEEIEAKSFRIIDEEAPRHNFTGDEWQILRRMIHTTADFALIEVVRFSSDAIQAGVHALQAGRPLYVDSNMIRSGLSLSRLKSVSGDYTEASIACHVSDEDVRRESRRTGLPRSLHAVRKAKSMLHGSITIFGNAPIALLELNRLIVEEGIKPSLVIGMPVGFVHVIESKQELMSIQVPFITITGRRGGSPLAVSAVHALCGLAAARKGE